MRRRFALVFTLTAWLLATGSHWDVVQAVAYARMFADNARTLPLGAALTRTFSPEGRCDVCSAVDTAKQAADHANAPASAEKFSGKVLLTHEPAARFFSVSPPRPRGPTPSCTPSPPSAPPRRSHPRAPSAPPRPA